MISPARLVTPRIVICLIVSYNTRYCIVRAQRVANRYNQGLNKQALRSIWCHSVSTDFIGVVEHLPHVLQLPYFGNRGIHNVVNRFESRMQGNAEVTVISGGCWDDFARRETPRLQRQHSNYCERPSRLTQSNLILSVAIQFKPIQSHFNEMQITPSHSIPMQFNPCNSIQSSLENSNQIRFQFRFHATQQDSSQHSTTRYSTAQLKLQCNRQYSEATNATA